MGISNMSVRFLCCCVALSAICAAAAVQGSGTELRVSDGNRKIIAADGTFTVNGNVLGNGQWITNTRFIVNVKAWGNIWWVGQVAFNAGTQTVSGMKTTTVKHRSQCEGANPRHFEAGSQGVSSHTAGSGKFSEATAAAFCKKKCQAKGFCCNDFRVGSNQMLSCAQACMIRARGTSQQQCEGHCDRNGQSGCQKTIGAHTYSMCSRCKDLKASCPWGVHKKKECTVGCTMTMTTPSKPSKAASSTAYECTESKNFIVGVQYRQRSLTDGCKHKGAKLICDAHPIYGGANSHALHMKWCKAQCTKQANCIGFFMQKHMNGHEICGFYHGASPHKVMRASSARWVHHNHKYGAVCQLSQGQHKHAAPAKHELQVTVESGVSYETTNIAEYKTSTRAQCEQKFKDWNRKQTVKSPAYTWFDRASWAKTCFLRKDLNNKKPMTGAASGTYPTVKKTAVVHTVSSAASECIGAFSHNKKRWSGGKKGEDALTWYVAPHRADFNFRTKVFGGFPRVLRTNQRKVSKNTWHRVEVQLSLKKATYSVDGKHFASVSLRRGEVPKTGFVGMIRYASTYEFKHLSVVNTRGVQVFPRTVQAQEKSQLIIEPKPDPAPDRTNLAALRAMRLAHAMTCMLLFVVLMLGLCWGYCERQKRRREAEEKGGFPRRAGDYATGLFECFGYPRVCFPSCLFTPVLAAFNRAEADKRECGVCDVCFSLKPQITQYQTRQSVRASHQLEEAPITDCISALCCTPCAIGQDTLELERRAAAVAPAPANQVMAEVVILSPPEYTEKQA